MPVSSGRNGEPLSWFGPNLVLSKLVVRQLESTEQGTWTGGAAQLTCQPFDIIRTLGDCLEYSFPPPSKLAHGGVKRIWIAMPKIVTHSCVRLIHSLTKIMI